ESGIDEHLHRRRARAEMGRKVFGFSPVRKFCRTNIVAGYVNGKSIVECAYRGTMDTEFFNVWVEQFFGPTLTPGQVVVMDNASFHKHRRSTELVAAAGCSLLYIPPYSPDLNPIEKFWAHLKKMLCYILPTSPSFFSALQRAFVK
ncbi:MAG: transposase, partial [Puniceicoccales bacterium]|nr:transposase [Puniceicoccales bacterium]